VGPALAFYVLLFVAPAIGSLWISLHSWYGPGTPFSFVGLQNFANLPGDPVYRTSFVNTVVLLVGVGLLVFFCSFAFMAALQTFRGRKTLRAILFFPNVVPPIALGIVWLLILNPNFGFVDAGLRRMGLGAFALPWLSSGLIFPTAMVGLVWIYTGFFTVILLAGADRIPRDYFDAADVAGANGLQRFLYITLPMTWDVVTIAAVLWLIAAIKIFDFLFVFTGGVGVPPQTSAWTLGVHMYEISLGTREPIYALGYGSAIAVSMVVLVAILAVTTRRFMSREAIEF
jgi:raffinose/stachyose/melibiose transport system permease protein